MGGLSYYFSYQRNRVLILDFDCMNLMVDHFRVFQDSMSSIQPFFPIDLFEFWHFFHYQSFWEYSIDYNWNFRKKEVHGNDFGKYHLH